MIFKNRSLIFFFFLFQKLTISIVKGVVIETVRETTTLKFIPVFRTQVGNTLTQYHKQVFLLSFLIIIIFRKKNGGLGV